MGESPSAGAIVLPERTWTFPWRESSMRGQVFEIVPPQLGGVGWSNG
jgi:hypothetical protein